MLSNFNNENENGFSSISIISTMSIGAFNLIWITLFELEVLANQFAFLNNCIEKLRVLIFVVETVVDVVSEKYIHNNIWLEG